MFFVPQILPHLEQQTPSAPARTLAAQCTDHLVVLYYIEGDTPVLVAATQGCGGFCGDAL